MDTIANTEDTASVTARLKAMADVRNEPAFNYVANHEADAVRVADWAADMAAPDERHILHRALMNMYRMGRLHAEIEAAGSKGDAK